MRLRRDVSGFSERVCRRVPATDLLPLGPREIAHGIDTVRAVRLEYPPFTLECEDGLDAARDIVGQQTDGPSRCDGQQMTVADAVTPDPVPEAGRQPPNEATGKISVGLKRRKRALLFCQLN